MAIPHSSANATLTPQVANAPLVPEAGFVEIADDAPATSKARLFYSFHPADESPETKPLAMIFNGGPGYSSASLLTLNTGRVAIADAANVAAMNLAAGASGAKTPPSLVDNPNSFTQFANLLYVDARLAGFSYDVVDDSGIDAFPTRFDSNTDAGEFLEVLLRFLAAHPSIQGNSVVLVGESYGGARATLMESLLFNYASQAPPLLLPLIQARSSSASRCSFKATCSAMSNLLVPVSLRRARRRLAMRTTPASPPVGRIKLPIWWSAS